MRQLDRILSAYGVDATDKPAFRALVELGIRPDASFRRKLRGVYKACLDEVLTELTRPIAHIFPPSGKRA